MTRKIAVYGSYKAKMPVTYKQRYWKRTKAGTKQRYRKKVTRIQKTKTTGRYEFTGKGKDLYNAVRKAIYIMPKGHVVVSAEKFAESPELYGFEGEWIEREIES